MRRKLNLNNFEPIWLNDYQTQEENVELDQSSDMNIISEIINENDNEMI